MHWNTLSTYRKIFQLAKEICLMIGFFVIFVFRGFVAKLKDTDLSDFIANFLFRDGFCTLMVCIFFGTETTNCVVVKGLDDCVNMTYSAVFLSLWTGAIWFLRILLYVNIKTAKGSAFSYSWYHFAKFKMKAKQILIFLLFFIFVTCFLFMLASLSSENPDGKIIVMITIIGTGCIVVVAVMEVFIAIKHARKMRKKEKEAQMRANRQDSSDSSSDSEDEDIERGRATSAMSLRDTYLVDSLHWNFVLICFIFNVANSIVFLLFAVSEYDTYQDELAQFLTPFNGLLYVLSIFMKPKKSTVHYKRFHRLHFFAFIVVSEVSLAIGEVKHDEWGKAAFCIARIVLLWFPLYTELLRLRKVISRLQSFELSRFLTLVVLKGGCYALVPVLFFMFETLSCIMNENTHWFKDQTAGCKSSNFATVFLSANVVIYMIAYIALSGVGNAVLYELGHVRQGSMFSMDMKKRQKVQLVLGWISLCSNPALIGALGVPSKKQDDADSGEEWNNAENDAKLTMWIGVVGTACGAVSLIIEMREVRRASYTVSRRRRSEVETMTTLYENGRRFSSQEMCIEELSHITDA